MPQGLIAAQKIELGGTGDGMLSVRAADGIIVAQLLAHADDGAAAIGVGHSPDHPGRVEVFDVSGHSTVSLHGSDGTITATGTISAYDVVLAGADFAEEFAVADSGQLEAGTVVVLGNDGTLVPSDRAYDHRVAGVLSGAGEFKPGVVLDKRGTHGRLPVALVGQVYCKVDADYGPVEVGDLLTTSQTPGHAMRAGDSSQALGAVLGKALAPLEAGQALLPILVALQ
jgi:hypothetical protein